MSKPLVLTSYEDELWEQAYSEGQLDVLNKIIGCGEFVATFKPNEIYGVLKTPQREVRVYLSEAQIKNLGNGRYKTVWNIVED